MRNGFDLTHEPDGEARETNGSAPVISQTCGALVARMTANQEEAGSPRLEPLVTDDASTLPADDGPGAAGDELGVGSDLEWDTPLYDPFDRPEGEVVVQAFSPSRSRSPRRA